MKRWYMTQLEAFEPRDEFQAQFNVPHNGKDFLHLWKETEVVPGTKISYSWRYRGVSGESWVTFVLATDEMKTRLKLTYADIGSFLPDQNPDMGLGNFFAGWTALVAQLQGFVEKRTASIGKPFVITREFAAPRELVWKVWRVVELMKHWFGPKECTIAVAKMDFQPGGMFHCCMQSVDGKKMRGRAVYREISAPDWIIWVNSFSDEAGGLGRHPFAPTWPKGMLTVATFKERAGKTTITIEWTPLNATD